jgi:PAS domain S-box-containing protein
LLPLLVLLFALTGGAVAYFVELHVHQRVIEEEFTRERMLYSTTIQSEIERCVQRDDLEMVQTVFAELGVMPDVRTALFLDATDNVLASTRREMLGRSFDPPRLGLSASDLPRLHESMQSVRRAQKPTFLLTTDKNELLTMMPTALPLRPGALGVQRRGVIVVVYDLRAEKANQLAQLQRNFFIFLGNIVVIALALGIGLHVLITRRLERLEAAMAGFVGGKSDQLPLPRGDDEIAHLVRRFNEMATTIRKAMDEVQDLYNHAPCGYHSLDSTGTFVRMNDTELSWLGYTRDEVIGRLHLSDLLPPERQEEFDREFALFKERGFIKDAELELVRKDGSRLPVVVSGTTVRDADGRFLKSRSVLYDVTELKRAEEKINRLNAELEHRVQVRTQQLADANRELVAFSYSISHDLRTPLRAINGFSYALARDYADKLDARALDDLQRVRAASQRMGQLIDDMVRLLHISRVEMHWGEVDLSRLATEVGADFSQAEPERAIRLTIAPDCRVQGDTALLRIVLENALGNAWKYTRTTPEPAIEFGRIGEGAGATYFVRDNGCGFDMTTCTSSSARFSDSTHRRSIREPALGSPAFDGSFSATAGKPGSKASPIAAQRCTSPCPAPIRRAPTPPQPK